MSKPICVATQVAILSLLTQGCQEVVNFTHRPIDGLIEHERPDVRTEIFLASPIDFGEVEAGFTKRLPERIAKVRVRLKRAACYERNSRRRCESAEVRGVVLRDGPAHIVGKGREVHVVVPLSYELKAVGAGSAKSVRGNLKGQLSVSGVYKLTLDENLNTRARFTNSYQWKTQPTLTVLQGQLFVGRLVTDRLARSFRRFANQIERAIDAQPAAQMLNDAWRNLYYPIRMSAEPAIWLRGEPRKVYFAGLSGASGDFSLRFGITTHLKTFTDGRPMPLIPLSLPELSSDAPDRRGSQVLLPIVIEYKELKQRFGNALPKGKVTSATNVDQAPIVEVTDYDIFSAGSRVSISVDLKAEVPGAWRSTTGKAFLIGTAKFAKGAKRLSLAHPQFPEPTPKPPLVHNGQFLLPEAPFTDAFEKTIAVDLDKHYETALRIASRWSNARFTDSMTLNARFHGATVHSVLPERDGLLLNISLMGDLAISADAWVEGVGSLTTTAETGATQ